MPAVLLASQNRGKLHEIQALFDQLPGEDPALAWLSTVQLLLPADLNLDLDVVEDGATYAENAGLKANAFKLACAEIKNASPDIPDHLAILADDSGLEVDPLGGAPGMHSARFAPPNTPYASGRSGDADRRAYLLQCLQPYPQPWTAHFHCTIAIASVAGNIQYVTGICPGIIQPFERGNNGFGYDPIFYLPKLEKTMAELSVDEKNRLSHRARAVRAAVPVLFNLFFGRK